MQGAGVGGEPSMQWPLFSCTGGHWRLGQEMSIEHHPHPTSPSSPVKTEEIWKIFVAKCLVSV